MPEVRARAAPARRQRAPRTTGSEHTTAALVCAALQQVGYQRPLPQEGRHLCPRPAYLSTHLSSTH